MERLTYETFLDKACNEASIPPMPASVIRARELIKDENSSIKAIAALIEDDPSIAAKVLRVSNSPYYGFSRKIDSIETALIVLGLNTTCNILESMTVLSAFSGRVETRFFTMLTRHCVLVAVACSIVTEMLGVNLCGSDYTAGLLHDIGHAAIRVVCPDHALALEKEGSPFMLGCEKEKTLIGIDHCVAGKVLAELWTLPEVISECIETHHFSLAKDHRVTVPGVVRLGVRLVRCLWEGEDKDSSQLAIPPGHFAFSLPIQEVMKEFSKRAEEIEEMVDLLAT